MEQIHLRITGTGRRQASRERVAAELARQLTGPHGERSLAQISLYASATVETDLCVQLQWHRRLPPEGSSVGAALAAGMRSVGTVRHTVWHEREPGNGSQPNTQGGSYD